MLHNDIEISGTASSGTFSVNTPKLVSGLLKLIIVKSATNTTTFDFDLTDEKDNIIFTTETKATGALREQVEIPIKNIITMRVFNSSVNETFTGKLVSEE